MSASLRVLVVGGTGLISTAITKRLLELGHDVTHFNRGKSPVRIDGVVTTLRGDRNNPADLVTLSGAGEWDAAIDMCCYHPDQLEGMAAALRGRVGQLVFCSTVDVYAKPAARFPLTEASLRASRTEYGRNKAACEDRLHQMGTEGWYASTVLRPSCTYGEGGVVVHTFGWGTWFLRRLEQGLPVVVFGDGTSLWSWCHVDDAAVAFCGALGNRLAHGESYHFASDEWLTWEQSVHTVAQVLGAPAPSVVHVPVEWLHALVPQESAISVENFSWPNVYDCSKAARDLGFKTTVSLEEGMLRTIDHIRATGGFAPLTDDTVTERVLEAAQRARQEFLR